MKKRKSPIRHRVKSHLRNKKIVKSFMRGIGYKRHIKIVGKIKESKKLGTLSPSEAYELKNSKWIKKEIKTPSIPIILKQDVEIIYLPKQQLQTLTKDTQELDVNKTVAETKIPESMSEQVAVAPTGYFVLFEAVKNKEHWKYPTKPVIVTGENEAKWLANSIAYYQGGSKIYPLEKNKFLVLGEGYYHYIGG